MSLLDNIVKPHGRSGRLGPLMMASLDHALWFHKALRVDDWLLYVQDSPAASGGRGFARAVSRLCPNHRIGWFCQSANKEARILSNSATALHLVRFPRGWNLRWPELYAHLTTYRRRFRANRWHDAADVVTGIVEREAPGRNRARVRGVRFL